MMFVFILIGKIYDQLITKTNAYFTKKKRPVALVSGHNVQKGDPPNVDSPLGLGDTCNSIFDTSPTILIPRTFPGPISSLYYSVDVSSRFYLGLSLFHLI